MIILVCPDSFKDSLNSKAITRVFSKEIKNINSEVNIIAIPMADGGEGTLDIINSNNDFEIIEGITSDPLGRSVVSSFLWDSQNQAIIVEMAQASGIERLALKERNCMNTSSYGTGIQIKLAIEKYKPKKIYLTLGSSATNDAGLGMLSAMGCMVYNTCGRIIDIPKGSDLINVSKIVVTEAFKSLVVGVEVFIINDVENVFSGLDGAAHTYASQKGASKEDVLVLDKGLQVIRDIVIEDKGINLDYINGAGAAGGMAGGGYAYMNAKMISGTEFISQFTKLEDAIRKADLVITGEGRLDHQTLQGKLVYHVAELCELHGKDMIVVCGANEMSADELTQIGDPAVYALNEYNNGKFTDETTIRDLKKVVNDIFKNVVG